MCDEILPQILTAAILGKVNGVEVWFISNPGWKSLSQKRNSDMFLR